MTLRHSVSLEPDQVESYMQTEGVAEQMVGQLGFLCVTVIAVKDVGNGHSTHALTRCGPHGVPADIQDVVIQMLRETADRLERSEPTEVPSA